MVVLNSRAKGANAERELAKILAAWALEIGITLDLERNLEQVRSGGHDLLGIPGLATEVKRVEILAVGSWWGQCVSQAKIARAQPLLVYRQSRKPWTFMTLAYVWPCKATPLVISMAPEEARLWFHAHLVAMMEQGMLATVGQVNGTALQ